MGNNNLINTIKRMVERGQTKGLQEKLDMFVLGERISKEEYQQLTDIIKKKELVLAFK